LVSDSIADTDGRPEADAAVVHVPSEADAVALVTQVGNCKRNT
jgi:hypothetical protein